MELIIEENRKTKFDVGDIVVIKRDVAYYQTIVCEISTGSSRYHLVLIAGKNVWTSENTLEKLNERMKAAGDEYVIYPKSEYDLRLTKK